MLKVPVCSAVYHIKSRETLNGGAIVGGSGEIKSDASHKFSSGENSLRRIISLAMATPKRVCVNSVIWPSPWGLCVSAAPE